MTVLLWAAGACAVGGASAPVRPASARRIELAHGFYWLVTPPRMDPDTRYPLVVCLHGTETRAADILNFWRSLQSELPLILAAPQGMGPGWRDGDLPLLYELRDRMADTIPRDPERILLTGHSAGGAMAFHLLYVEAFPATAVAVTANYLPPTVTAQQVQRRNDVPLFYAVGEADVNRPRMRRGLEVLREAGAQVTVRRPPIGHTLSHEMGQAALDWFIAQCRRTVDRHLDQARSTADAGDRADPGPPAAVLEGLLRHRAGHFPGQIAQAEELLTRLQRAGRSRMAEAHHLSRQAKQLEARDMLIDVERRYRPSALAAEAARRRLDLEAQPRVAQLLAARVREETRRKAADLWHSAQLALSDARVDEAKLHCRNLLALYPNSAVAADARRVLEQLESAHDSP